MAPVALSVEEAAHLLRNLDVKKSQEDDGISATVIKSCSNAMTKHLFILYNRSLERAGSHLDEKLPTAFPS